MDSQLATPRDLSSVVSEDSNASVQYNKGSSSVTDLSKILLKKRLEESKQKLLRRAESLNW